MTLKRFTKTVLMAAYILMPGVVFGWLFMGAEHPGWLLLPFVAAPLAPVMVWAIRKLDSLER